MSRAIHAIVFCIFFTKFSFQKNFEAYNDNDTSGNKNGNNQQQGSMIEEKSPSFTQGLDSLKTCPMSIRLCYLYLFLDFVTFHTVMLCYKVFHKNYNYITMSGRKIRSLYKLFLLCKFSLLNSLHLVLESNLLLALILRDAN